MDILNELTKHCGGYGFKWWLDHYINFTVKRQDGMTDLEYLLFKAKSDPSLNELVTKVKDFTSSAVFGEAEKAVVQNFKRFSDNVREIAERKEAENRIEDSERSPLVRRSTLI
jgi:hypothetical protein